VLAGWAAANMAGTPAYPTASGVTAESTAVTLDDELVESSAANKKVAPAMQQPLLWQSSAF